MKTILQLPSGSGFVSMEVAENDSGDGRMGFSLSEAVNSVADTFESALEPVEVAVKAVAQQVLAQVDAADEVQIEFGVKFNSKIGFYIAAADSEASLKVTLKNWQIRYRT